MPRLKQRHPPHLPLRIRRPRQRPRTIHQPLSAIAPKQRHLTHRICKLAIPLALIIHESLKLLAHLRMRREFGVGRKHNHALRRLDRFGVVLNVPDARGAVLRLSRCVGRRVEVELVRRGVGT
jgi:hypothetical protein